jgi:hypothetical protein
VVSKKPKVCTAALSLLLLQQPTSELTVMILPLLYVYYSLAKTRPPLIIDREVPFTEDDVED